MSSSDEVERLRRRLDADPGDDQARADLAPLLARDGDREGAAEAWYIAACGARRRGDEALFRERIRRCLEVDPSHPLVFTAPPTPPQPGDQAWARILVAHPESRVRGPIARLLADRGYAVEEAATAGSARTALKQVAADLILTAPQVVDGDALAIATAARKSRPQAAIVLLTCAAKSERIDAAAQLAPLVDEHLDRPIAPDRLLEAIRSALWRHRHAKPVAAIERHPSHGDGPGWRDSVTRSALLVLAGYALIFTVHATLAAIPGLAPDRSLAAALAAPPERSLPPEVDRRAESALWVERTSTDSSPDLRVVVTALDPALVAARVHRARRQGPVPRPASAAEVWSEIDRLAPASAVSFEVHIEARNELAIDPAAVVASLRLRAADRPAVAPSRVSPREEMRFVRESAEGGGAPRVRALTFSASFPRATLGEASVYALSLAAGGRETIVFVPAPPRR